jgi:hypothetical protein
MRGLCCCFVLDVSAPLGVGITGHLPEEAGEEEERCQSTWMDPTERLAVALGLAVDQLAHYTHHQPVNPDTAVHRLRCPVQHARLTAAATARQSSLLDLIWHALWLMVHHLHWNYLAVRDAPAEVGATG